MANWHLSLAEVYRESSWWLIFLNKGCIRGRVYYITPLIWLGSAPQDRAWFIQDFLSLQFFQRKEITFRQLQQLHAGTGLVPASQKEVLGLPGSASCTRGFLVTWSTIRQAIVLNTDYLQPQKALLPWLIMPSASKVTFVTFRREAAIRAIQALNQSPKMESLQILEHVSRKYWKCFQKVQTQIKY